MQDAGNRAGVGRSRWLAWSAGAGFVILVAGEIFLAQEIARLQTERAQLVASLNSAHERIQELTDRPAPTSAMQETSVSNNLRSGQTASTSNSTPAVVSAHGNVAPPESIESRLAQLEQRVQESSPISGMRRLNQPAPKKIGEYNVNNPPPQEIPVEEAPTAKVQQPLPPGLRSWGEEQAVGAPNAVGNSDNAASWASKSPDGGAEWLSLAFENQVDVAEVRIRENHNPGAISRVTAMVNGQEVTLWEGTAQRATDSRDFVVPVNGNVRSGSIIVHMDTARVPGWNEIDAVELVGRDGSRQWAANSSASSTYAQPRTAQTEQPQQGVVGFDYFNK